MVMVFCKICYGMSNMAEIETPHPETPKEEHELISAEELAMFNELGTDSADGAEAARRLVEIDNKLVLDEPLEIPTPEPSLSETPLPEAPRKEAPAQRQETSPRVKRNRAVAGAVGVSLAAGVGAGIALNEALEEPEFSQETTTYTLEPGDGLWDAAEEIKGADAIDLRDAVHFIEVDPANTDVLKDGLHPGEQLVIPVNVVGHENDE